MRKLLIIIFVLMGVTVSQAQDAWPVIQNCMGGLTYPTIPRGKWDFGGVIVSSVYPQGVRGIRADRNVDYFIALESGDSFPAAGAVSPDGQYFAYPIGHTSYHVNTIGDDLLGVDYVSVVRTDGITDEKYRFEANDYAYSTLLGSLNLTTVKWFGPDRVYYPNLGNEPALVNFKTGETKAWTPSVSPYDATFISPDGTRAFAKILYDLENDMSLEYPPPEQVVWFADSSAFIAAGDSLSLVSRDGELIETLWQDLAPDIAVAPNQKAFAFRDEQQNLFIGDMEQKVIYDLCFVGKESFGYGLGYYFSNLAWSPDSSSLAFSYDGYLVILNTQTFTNQVIDHHTLQVMGWHPLPGEVIEPVAEGVRPPQPTPTLAPTTAPPTAIPTATTTPQVAGCQLEVLTGANLRAGAGADTEKTGSAAVSMVLTADAQQYNSAEFFRWWRLTTGEWIREDFVKEAADCEFLPEVEQP